MDHSKKGAIPTAYLTDDLIVEILSRLPVRSVCRFKCVSRHWYYLISHPEHRKKLTQTLSGFFYEKSALYHQDDMITFPSFEGILGDQEHLFPDPSFPFLTGYKEITPSSCCNGLVLCDCRKESPRYIPEYVVCNPATEEWVVLPYSDDANSFAYHLGFDPAFSDHFHVFQILYDDEEYRYIEGVNIYLSETGLWSYKESGWVGYGDQIVDDASCVFFNGTLHLLTQEFQILAVDTEGKTWRTISLLKTMRSTESWLGTPFMGHYAFYRELARYSFYGSFSRAIVLHKYERQQYQSGFLRTQTVMSGY